MIETPAEPFDAATTDQHLSVSPIEETEAAETLETK